MTPNKEDFIKAIYTLGGKQQLVSNKALAKELGISPASVTEMLNKLQNEGFIEYIPYKGSKLTDAGVESCIDLVRSHRLWEVFLIRHLDYSWSEAHEDAHLLEHAAPARMMERLDRFLNYPAYCPHGSVIPHSRKLEEQTGLRALSQLAAGERAVIRRVTEEKELMDYLEALGIVIGGGVRVLEQAPYEGPIMIDMEGTEIAISYKAAQKLFVSQT